MNVLAVDGGGVVIPCALLWEIEQRSGKKISELFHLVVSVSTGVIPALYFTSPGLRRYEQKEDLLGVVRKLMTNKSVFKSTVETEFSGLRLRDVRPDLAVVCYDTNSRDRYSFKSRKARIDLKYDFSLKNVVSAACASPGHLDPFELRRPDGRTRLLIDGSILGNNPTAFAVREARQAYKKTSPIVVSLGTGSASADKGLETVSLSDTKSLMFFTEAASGSVSGSSTPEFSALNPTEATQFSITPYSLFRFDVDLHSETKKFWITDEIYQSQIKAANQLISSRTADLENLCQKLLGEK